MGNVPHDPWKSLGTLIYNAEEESMRAVELIESSGFEAKMILDDEARRVPCLINATGQHVGYENIVAAIEEHLQRSGRKPEKRRKRT